VLKTLDPKVEACRLDGDPADGPDGVFRLRHPETRELLMAIVSSGLGWVESGFPGPAWEHASVSHRRRVPTWEEMCWVKGLFWPDDEWVVQFHPAKADYVNDHEFVLHLWRCAGVPFPKPPRECV